MLITLCIVLAVLAGMFLVLIAVVEEIVRVANEYSQQVVHMAENLLEKLKKYNVHVDEEKIIGELETRLPGVISSTVGTVTTIISHGFLIAFFMVFLLLGRNPQRRPTGIYADIENTIRSYITTMTAISALTSVLVGIVLWALGLHMAWLFAFLVFLFTFIPNVGPIVATLLPLPVAVTQFHDPWMILATLAIPGAIHMTIGNLVTPRRLGRGMELHPVTVLLALAFWGLIWGIVGMVLAMPIMATLRIILSRFNTTRPLAELLAGHLPGTEMPLAGEAT